MLLNVFSDHVQLKTKLAEDKEPLRPGVIYFAPPDYHLLIERTMSLALDSDEPVLFSRPSIDLLFESAGDSLHERVIGVLLSGANSDGAAGLQSIHAHGGRTLVQDPRSARYSAMPQAALDRFQPQRVLPLQAIGPALLELGAGAP
jgi:two-component system chemotaxis response regulator CheB